MKLPERRQIPNSDLIRDFVMADALASREKFMASIRVLRDCPERAAFIKSLEMVSAGIVVMMDFLSYSDPTAAQRKQAGLEIEALQMGVLRSMLELSGAMAPWRR